MDRSIPRSAEIDRFIDEHRPDLLLVTPVVREGSPQSDYVRSARARGVRTVFCVASWDNLTNKGLIHDQIRPRDGLERGDEAGGRRVAWRAAGTRGGHRSAVV